jgi:hypothetical protein
LLKPVGLGFHGLFISTYGEASKSDSIYWG